MSISAKSNLILASILVIFSIAAGITFVSLNNSKEDTSIVNALGRQRMLSQAMAKSALAFGAAKNELFNIEKRVDSLGRKLLNPGLEEYEVARDIFSETILAMKKGGEYPVDLARKKYKTIAPIKDEASQQKIIEVEASFTKFTAAVDNYLTTQPGSTSARSALNEILTESNNLRKQSNDLVVLYNRVAQQNHSNIFYTMLVMLIAVFAIVILAGIFTRVFLFARINETVDSLREIARGDGDLTRRMDAHKQDELGQLAQAFNEFTEKIQGLVGQVQNSGSHLKSASQQMQSIVGQANQGIVQQQNDIESVAHAMDEMTTAVQEVSRNTATAHEAAQRVDDQARNGREVVTKSVNTIQQMSSDMQQVSKVINRLNEESISIGTVLDVIRGVAEQTNLLALNAAIEAARAGEQGRGFAVVADEVRTLASRTQSSTADIQSMIERLQQGTSEAVKVMGLSQDIIGQGVVEVNQADDSLNAITSSVAGIKDMSTQIASAAEQQTQVAGAISSNVGTIKDSAADTVKTMQTLSSNTLDLAELAQQMDTLVGQFKV